MNQLDVEEKQNPNHLIIPKMLSFNINFRMYLIDKINEYNFKT